MNRFVCMSVCLSHFFWNPYILQLIHSTYILIKYNIFRIKKIRIFFSFFFQKSSLFIDKSWVLTSSFYICQNIYFADILIKHKIFLVKKTFFLYFFLKSSLFLYKSWFSTISFNIFQNIHFINIFIKYKMF